MRWGLLCDAREGTAAMPGPKIEKAAYLLADPALDYGCKAEPWNFAEVHRGNRQYWALAMRPMRGLVGFTDILMRGMPRLGGRAEDGKSDLIWEDF